MKVNAASGIWQHPNTEHQTLVRAGRSTAHDSLETHSFLNIKFQDISFEAVFDS